jgi:antitoxin MazE
MKEQAIWKLIPIGNSQGLRLPKILIEKYGMESGIRVEALEDRLILRGKNPPKEKISWKATYQEMSKEQSVESEWETTDLDGLDSIPWNSSS